MRDEKDLSEKLELTDQLVPVETPEQKVMKETKDH